MPTETVTIIRVEEDHHVLEPGGTLSIKFNPDVGPAVIKAHSSRAPDDLILGGSPTRLIAGAQEILVAARDTTPLDAFEAFVFARRGHFVGPDLVAGVDVVEFAIAPDQHVGELGGGDHIAPQINTIRMEIIRPGEGLGAPETVLSAEVPSQTARIHEIGQLPAVMVGFARSSWTARFTNIANVPMQIFGQILYRERRKVKITTLPENLMSRLLRQAVAGLGLNVKLEGDTVSVDFNESIKELAGMQKITKDIGFDVFGEVKMSTIAVELSQGLDSRGAGPWPALKLKVAFEELGPELSIDIGTDIDINISNLSFEFEMILRQLKPDVDPPGARGDHPLIPYIFAEINFTSDIRFSSSAFGIARAAANDFVSAINAIAGAITNSDKDLIGSRVPTLSQIITDAGQAVADDLSFELSQYVQIALNRIADREHLFHGVRLSGTDWQVLTGPIFEGVDPMPLNAPAVIPLANPEPIDGPQAPEELEALNRINHFVVLMMENRSYDHVLGWHSHPDHGNNPEFEGLTGNEVNQIDGLNDAIPVPMQTTKFFPSPPHGFEPVLEQIDNGQMTGFGNTFEQALDNKGLAGDARSIMNFNTQGMLRTYDRFVGDYTLAKHWFAAHPGPTWPNRFCTLCGQTPILRNGDLPHDDLGYLPTPTLFDLLDENDVNWRCYEHDIAFLRMMDKYRIDSGRIRPFEQFEDEALAGLPEVTIIEPNFVDVPSGGVSNDDHPGGADMANGQRLIAQIYNVLIRTPGWANTMFIVTYDEHGGFFDHVPPPGSAVAAAQGFGNVHKVHPDGPNMLGPRVPAFIVSPRADPGRILSRVYDHTSIAKSIIARFLPGNEHKLSRRVETAAHLGGAVPRAIARTDAVPLPIPAEVAPAEREDIEALSFHADMSSLGNPMNDNIETLRAMKPKFRPGD